MLSKPRSCEDARRCRDHFHGSQQDCRSGAQAGQDGPASPTCRIPCSFGAGCARPAGLQQDRSEAVGPRPAPAAAWERWCLWHRPPSTYAPSPEQLATILGALICCALSSQNICLKKDQIFIAHLCILLKGEMRLVMVDKCQSMCEESTCKEKKGRERKGEKEHFFNL